MLKIEHKLKTKIRNYGNRRLRNNRVDEIFDRCIYLFPHNFKVVNYPREPVASFNPAILPHRDNAAHIIPRLVFEYYSYVSSIGITEKVQTDKLLEGEIKDLNLHVILHPTKLWEILGCEDPRVHLFHNRTLMLYTGKGITYRDEQKVRRDVLALAELDRDFNVERKGFFKIAYDGEETVPPSNKDASFLKVEGDKATMLVRPEIDGRRICWRCEASLYDLTLDGKTLEPVMLNEPWEGKVGWSTNAVRLSSNEYLIGWHGVVLNEDSYKNGLAIVDDYGELLGISDYLLSPRNLPEMYGDKPLTIFGCGLSIYKEYLIWVGGISDYGVAVFKVELEKALEKIRKINH